MMGEGDRVSRERQGRQGNSAFGIPYLTSIPSDACDNIRTVRGPGMGPGRFGGPLKPCPFQVALDLPCLLDAGVRRLQKLHETG
jgi:hypothetical protein